MEKLSTITEMQNVLNRAYKLDLYEILKISDTLFDDIDRLRYLIHKSIPNKIVYKERIVNDRTFYIYRCPICDSEYGFWGEDFLSFLEKEYGKIPIFKIKNEKGEYVQIDNFWGNPRICWKKKDGSLAAVSFREKESEYEFGESQIFYKAGFEMLNELLRGYI